MCPGSLSDSQIGRLPRRSFSTPRPFLVDSPFLLPHSRGLASSSSDRHDQTLHPIAPTSSRSSIRVHNHALVTAQSVLGPLEGNTSEATLPTMQSSAAVADALTAEAKLGARHNIFYTRDIWARATATRVSACLSAAFVLALWYVAYHALVGTRASSRGAKPLWQLSTMLADDANIDRLDTELDSDEYEDEHESRASGFLANARERHALRRMLARSEGKRSSIVRITSSDPSSSLSDHPMQVDLEPPTRRSFWPAPPSSTPPSDSAASSPTSSTPPPASARRRKESGRLAAAEPGRRQHTASPSRSPTLLSGSLPVRPTRIRPVERSPLGRVASRNKRNGSPSLATDAADARDASPSPTSPLAEDWADESQLSPTAAAPADHDALLTTPSLASEASFTSAIPASPASSTFSLRAPSILKRRPQSFRTASLRDIDISYSLMQRKASLPALPLADIQQQQQHDFWHHAAMHSSPAPPPYQPASPDAIHAVERSVKLIEPDWRPHLDSHVRAQERLEAATRFATAQGADGDFWFERFTQSTAAAGRDWDWRKRRARLQRAAALGMALGQSGLAIPASPMPGNVGKTDVQLQHQLGTQPTPAAQAASPVRKVLPAAPLITFSEHELKSAPVLKVDTESGRRPARGSVDATSPTYSATPLSPTPSGTGTPLGGIFGAVLPSAESVSAVMAARMAQRRRASDDATASSALPAADDANTMRRGVVDKAMRRRLSASTSSAVPSSPGASPAGSPSIEGRGSPLRDSSPFPSDAGRTSMDAPSSPPGASAMSVPGRLSSLGTVGKKVSLTNLRAGLRRGSGSTDFMHDASGIELVPHSPDLSEGDTHVDAAATTSPEGPRSSADAYSAHDPLQGIVLSRTDSQLRHVEGGGDGGPKQRMRSESPQATPQFRGGSRVTKLGSAPAAVLNPPYDVVEELRDRGGERDSISQGSSDSDSLRRRLRSQTDSATRARMDSVLNNTARRDGLSLSPGTASSPPTTKARARGGSRSSIVKSASGASHHLDRSAMRRSSMRSGSDSGSLASSTSLPSTARRRAKDATPDPQLQPEPAPRGMAQRARSASISSNASSLASGSRKSSRSNSFREAAGLGMTSNPGTPGSPEERRGDPFSLTPLHAQQQV